MLLKSMSLFEVRSHLKNEYSTVKDRICNTVYSNKYRRAAVKLPDAREHYFKPFVVSTKNKTDFTIIPVAPYGKKTAKCLSFTWFTLTYQHRDDGTYFYMIVKNDKDDYLVIYSPHFIRRWLERTSTSLNENELSTFIQFLKDNPNTAYEDPKLFSNEEHQQNKAEIVTATNQGLMFGENLSDDLVLWKTFVPNDMLKDQQIANKAESDEYLKWFSSLTYKQMEQYDKWRDYQRDLFKWKFENGFCDEEGNDYEFTPELKEKCIQLLADKFMEDEIAKLEKEEMEEAMRHPSKLKTTEMFKSIEV